MADYTIRMEGERLKHGRIPSVILADLIPVLHRGAEGAVRLRLEGRSSAEGPSPAWLIKAATFDLVEVSKGASALRLQAPSLREALPERFDQRTLFPDIDPDQTALSFLSEAIEDAVRGREESDAYDDALLKNLERLRRIFRRGLSSLSLQNSRPDQPPVELRESGIWRIAGLQQRIPQPRRVRLAGWIDEIGYSTRAFKLLLESNRTVRGVLAHGSPDQLRGLFGKKAVVSGMARFRPSGSVHLIEADYLAEASDRDLAFWNELPEPIDRMPDKRALRQPQGPRTGINAIFGKWPGDETMEELLEGLRSLGE